MKKRVLSVVVTDVKGTVLFQKNPASPQDLMAILTLFEGDGVRIEICFNDVDLDVPQAKSADA